ncbi:MAG: chromosomal replication initiator protein DnaA [Elusimicrobia bacterium]|nr:chromosomal replication initiator protein DnaA [Elusimicrobiota bacterium]
MDNTTIDIKNIWQKALEKMESEIGAESMDLWIRPLNPLIMEGDVLKLEVPDSVIYDKIKERYEELLIKNIRELLNKNIQIQYSMAIAPPDIPKPEPIIEARPVSPAVHTSLNPNYNFESFVVGPSNRFTYSSAESVAKNPGSLNSNPFFIYSQPGLGKTHILHAIGNEIIKNNPLAKVAYTPCENFVNEYISTLQNKTTENFRNKYRKLDCLLLDDIQFLIGKERSEEEFFYTFNSLFESKKQIVVTSDRSPKELTLGERLVSRFLSGLRADIKIPDFETRVAILRQKRDLYKFSVPDDVLVFIAENVKRSIRELEGCLITVGNYGVNMKIQLSIDVVKEVIRDHITSIEHDEKVSIDSIMNVVAEKFKVEIKDLKSQKRTEAIAFPRQIAMYIACEITDMSLPGIGEAFGKDHTTVMYARDKIKHQILNDPYNNALINELISKIKTVSNK